MENAGGGGVIPFGHSITTEDARLFFSQADPGGPLHSGAYGTGLAEKAWGKRASRSDGIGCPNGIRLGRPSALGGEWRVFLGVAPGWVSGLLGMGGLTEEAGSTGDEGAGDRGSQEQDGHATGDFAPLAG